MQKRNDFFTTQATAARILGVSRQRVQQLLSGGELKYRTRVSGASYPVLHHDVKLSSVLQRAKDQGKLSEAIERLLQITQGHSMLRISLVKYLNSGGFNNDQQN